MARALLEAKPNGVKLPFVSTTLTVYISKAQSNGMSLE